MNSNDAEIAAGEWLARLDRDDPGPRDLAAFEQWKSEDPRHAAAYARLAATWQALDRVQAIRPGSDEPIDEDYLNIAMQNPYFRRPPEPHAVPLSVPFVPSVPSASIAPRHPGLWHRPRILFPAAASVLVALAALWISHGIGGSHTFSTGIGGFQRIILDDQSTVELNTNSEVRVAFTARLRRVELVRGEASFEVTHDTSRPFIVAAGPTAVRAVGTKFDVNRLEGAVEVTVDEGRVAIGSSSVLETKLDALPTVIPRLSAGQSAIASGGGVELENLRQGDLARKLAWRNQMLVFDGDSLADVIVQFNRYNKRQLVITDPTLAALRIGGYFRPTNLDAFVSVLQSDFGIRADVDDNRVELTRSTVK
jgi:transmembrane sensor